MSLEDVYKKYHKAGAVAAEAADLARSLVKPGVSVRDLGNKVEKFIKQKGIDWSFPINLSLDDCAAHYSPSVDDDYTLPDEGLLKIDLGTHVDGYIADHAITVDIGNSGGVYRKLIDAADEALKIAVENFHAGIDVVQIGAMIESVIKKHGFKPIENLGGHNLGQYSLHGGIFVPNVGSGAPYTLQEGDIFAVEPFATTGRGRVMDGEKMLIYRFQKRPKRKLPLQTMSYIEKIRKTFNALPFSPRWLEGIIPLKKIPSLIRQLHKQDVLQGYPILMEVQNGIVSQAEYTIIARDDHGEITTVTRA